MIIDHAKNHVLPFECGLMTNSDFVVANHTYLRTRRIVITGYNTDVEHDGVVYHVQTEDKGLDSPLILSLVYSGGAILASKRSHYDDLIASGFSDEALAERLKRQHRLICAAIHAGRIEDLKRMSQTGPLSLSQVPGASTPVEAGATAESLATQAHEPTSVASPVEPSDSESAGASGDVYTVHDHRRQSPMGELPDLKDGLRVTLVEERQFRSGDSFTLRVMVSYHAGNEAKPVSGAAVSVKILGTTFRPQIYSVKTERDGIASVSASIPKFTSGRAAILIRVSADGNEAEMRRVIQAG